MATGTAGVATWRHGMESWRRGDVAVRRGDVAMGTGGVARGEWRRDDVAMSQKWRRGAVWLGARAATRRLHASSCGASWST